MLLVIDYDLQGVHQNFSSFCLLNFYKEVILKVNIFVYYWVKHLRAKDNSWALKSRGVQKNKKFDS